MQQLCGVRRAVVDAVDAEQRAEGPEPVPSSCIVSQCAPLSAGFTEGPKTHPWREMFDHLEFIDGTDADGVVLVLTEAEDEFVEGDVAARRG